MEKAKFESSLSTFFAYMKRNKKAMKYVLPKQLFQCVCKAKPGRLMAINIGPEYVGVAITDLENKVPDESMANRLPLNDKSGKPKSDAVLASEIKELVDRNNVKGMVIGKLDLEQLDSRPLSSDAEAAKKFVEKLAQTNILSDMNYTYDKFIDMDVGYEGHGERGAVKERGEK